MSPMAKEQEIIKIQRTFRLSGDVNGLFGERA
jgi:hypothetical protein